MAVMTELGGIYTNPNLVETVEAVVGEQEIVKEGQPPIKEKTYEVRITMSSGRVWVVEAQTKDVQAHERLLKEIINQLNAGLNTQLAMAE